MARLRSKGPLIGNGIWTIKWSRDVMCCEAVRSAILATAWLLVVMSTFSEVMTHQVSQVRTVVAHAPTQLEV